MRNEKGQWVSGVSGNPAGRPPGSKDRFSEALYALAHREIEDHGDEVFTRLRQEDPVTWAKLMVKLAPKTLETRVEEHRTSLVGIIERISSPAIEDRTGEGVIGIEEQTG